MKVLYAHEFGQKIRSSAYKYYPPMQKRMGGRIVGVNGRRDWASLKKEVESYSPDLVLVRGDRNELFEIPLSLGIPYIVCENDVSSWRQEGFAREKKMLENAAGIIFTSDAHKDYLVNQGLSLPPSITVWLRPNRDSLHFDPLPKLPGKHLVYAGGLVVKRNRSGPWGYRCYHEIFCAFRDSGWTVHAYPTRPTAGGIREYQKLGITVHPTIPANKIYTELSQYTAGLHGYAWKKVPARSMDYALHCMPNKTWEYLAAGIPTVTVNGGPSSRVITSGGWGIEVGRDLSGLDSLELPSIDPQVRNSQVIDEDIDRLVDFCENTLDT